MKKAGLVARLAPRLRPVVAPDRVEPAAFRIGNDLAPCRGAIDAWVLAKLARTPRLMIRNATRGPRTAPPAPTEANHTPPTPK
jgi:hypothetical protein